MAQITVRDLTGGGADEAGLFEELMRTSKSHLLKEYDEGRLTGADYGNVYLGSLQSNLQASVQFLLQYPVVNQQLILLDEQIAQAKKQNELLALQKEKLQLDIDTAEFNLNSMLPEQLLHLKEQTKLVTEQVSNAVAQGTLLGSQNSQVLAQTQLVGKQEDLVDEQILDAKDKTNTPTAGINKAQYDKLLGEGDVLAQRKLTEQAQTVGTSSTVGGVLGSQIALVDKQRDGFDRDAEQKAAKIFGDGFSIVHSITPDADANGADDFGLGGNTAKQVMDKLRTGIGLSINP